MRIIESRIGSSEAGGIGAFLRMPGASAQQNAAIADLISDPAAALNVFERKCDAALSGLAGAITVCDRAARTRAARSLWRVHPRG